MAENTPIEENRCLWQRVELKSIRQGIEKEQSTRLARYEHHRVCCKNSDFQTAVYWPWRIILSSGFQMAMENRQGAAKLCNMSKYLSDNEALTERICADLEQLKYAHILTSLAMQGPLFSQHGQEKQPHPTGNTAAPLISSLDKINYAKHRSVNQRREKRQVKPTAKAREWKEGGLVRPPGHRRRNKAAEIPNKGFRLESVKDNASPAENSGLVNTVEHLQIDVQNPQNEDPAAKIGSPVEVSCKEQPVKKNRFRCDQCGKCFKTYYTYSIHIRMPEHTQETPFVCDVCGKGFRLSSTLCRHKIIHTSDKPHECQICAKTFNRSSTLKMHMRTHSGRKQHVCAECGKGFHQKGNLRNHMFVHSGERPYHCEACGRHFNKKSNLKHHLKIHEINGNLACTVCKTAFQKNEDLKKHMEIAHC